MLDNKNTGYVYEGTEISTVRPSGRPRTYRNPLYYDQDKKTDAATLYCVYGDLEEVSRITDVPVLELKKWREEPWWVEVQKKVYVEQNDKLASRITVVLDKAIDQIADRLDHGDQTYNPKTGEITRKPVEAKVLASLFDSLSHQRRLTRGEPTAIASRVGVDDRLNKLEEAFIRFAQAKTLTQDGEIQEN